MRLPTGIFYANGVKACVLFFDEGGPTEELWVYDYRTGVKHTMATRQMSRTHLEDFVECYCSGHREDRKETWSPENPTGRFRRFSKEDLERADTLDFRWLDLEEKDERQVSEILDDMQENAEQLAGAVQTLKTLLEGVEL